ncbi:uncharacterized protein LOC117181023 [Belonocnema kinseyi]|uniref:uncharacterized protein LOC117181023 n=1 Tax=Belonocnema kinseyi TaxID=2817044 RepID=UPI00143DF18F|nr:uncharacterized protein LOC117181023 [Belonocnema kinseyi]
MGKQIYLSLFIVGAILACEIGASSDENTRPHIRKKRLINTLPGGNRPTRIDQAPHLVSVHLNNNHTCSGTILYGNVILVMADASTTMSLTPTEFFREQIVEMPVHLIMC